jgi:hypothetical protein
MVRRGSTVRVRQRLRDFRCSACGSVVPAGGGRWRRRPRSVHQRPPWPLSGTQLVEQADRVLASVAGEVAVVPVDHGQAGAHVAGEVEGGEDSCRQRRARPPPYLYDGGRRGCNTLNATSSVQRWAAILAGLLYFAGQARELASEQRTPEDGALMEPRGRHRRQSPANRQAAETAETSQIRCNELPPVAMVRRGSTVQVRQRASPKSLHTGHFRWLFGRWIGCSTSTERPPSATTISQ